MATFDTSQAVTQIPVENRLGQFGVQFPRGKVVWIDTDDTVYESQQITEDQINATNGVTGAKDGSGDFGKAIFRRGKTYTITAGEDTLLSAAGYTTS